MLKRNLFFVIFFFSSVFATEYDTDFIHNYVEVSFCTSSKKEVQKIVDTNIIVKHTQNSNPLVQFFRYDVSSAEQIIIAGKSIPVTQTYTFSPGERVYISAKFPNIDQNSVTVNMNTHEDNEKLKLTKSGIDSPYFIGILETSVDSSFKVKDDGVLYVHDIDKITITKSGDKKSRSSNSVLASANVIYSLQTLEDEANSTNLWISQSKLHFVTTAGEYHKGVVTITNQSEKDLKDALISLALPKEIVLEESSCKINAIRSSKVTKALGEYHITLPNLKTKESATLEYHFSVSVAKQKELYGSLAVVHNHQNVSNRLKLHITLNKDHSTNPKKGFIAGKISGLEEDKGEGIVLYLSNGYSVTTDKNGKFHFEGVSAGLQVVQIDTDTIPDGFTPSVCKQNARSAGSRISSFMDLMPGMVKQVDFCLKKSAEKKRAKKRKKVFTPKIEKTAKMPKYSSSDISKYKDKKYKWLWPDKDGFVPSIGSIKTAILYPKALKLQLFLNGVEVDSLNSDGVLKNSKDSGAIALFRGIDIKDGDNYLKAQFVDKESNVKHSMSRLVHFSGAPVKAKLLKEKSFLIADGKNSPIIALQMFDRYGYFVRESVKGSFYIDAPYKVAQEADEKMKSSNYIVSANGIAYIKLQPTTLASDVKIHIPTSEEELQISVTLEPKMREWVLVGFGEGSVGYRKILNTLKKTDDKKIYSEGRTAFFAKGSILGDTLLTISYDSGKEPDLELFDRIDPDEYYTIYGDGSYQNSQAPSQKKLYVKMEKKEFSLLFGDMHTGLDKVELARYDRAMNGFKAVFTHKNIDATLFASESDNVFVKDEITPDATSGKYYLKNRNIIENSEKVYLVVRDRYRKEIVLEKKLLTPLLDYSIYYDEGALYFKDPVFGIAKDGNPRFIEVDYEISGIGQKEFIYGGRLASKSKDERYSAGLSYIKESKKSLMGVDFSASLSSHVDISAEYATTEEDEKKSATAYYLSSTYRDSKKEISAYVRKQEQDFGMGQHSSFVSNAQRYGIDAHLKYREYFGLYLSAYRDIHLTDQSATNVLEIKNSYRGKKYDAYLGYKYYDDELSSGSQLLGGLTRQFFNNRLKLQLSGEYSLENDNEYFPTRIALDGTYTITPKTDLFFRDEWVSFQDESTNIFSGGIRVKPWSEGMFKASLLSSGENDQNSLYSNYMLNQGYRVNKNLTLSGGLEHNRKISGISKDEDDYTTYMASTTYKKANWHYSAKTSYKDANENKINLDLGIYTEKKDLDLGLAFGIRTQKVIKEKNDNYDISSNLSLVYRPDGGEMVFNRFDYIQNKSDEKRVKKYSNRLMLSKKLTKNIELSMQYALKFTQTYLDDKKYDSLIDILDLDVVYDIGSKNDIGVNASIMHDWTQKLYNTEYGIYTGYKLFKNSWLTVGYNFSGFYEDENGDYIDTTDSAYLKLRVKFDQSSLREITEINNIY